MNQKNGIKKLRREELRRLGFHTSRFKFQEVSY